MLHFFQATSHDEAYTRRDRQFAQGDSQGLPIDLLTRMEALEAQCSLLRDRVEEADIRTTKLEKENSDLWQRVSRLTGPRLPPEICWSIIEWVADDRSALKNFSLVCKGWMYITRKTLFSALAVRQTAPWLLEERIESSFCSIFPHVKQLVVTCDSCGSNATEETLAEILFNPTWMDNFLLHIPKFTGLIALSLWVVGPGELNLVVQALSPHQKSRVQTLSLSPKALGMVHIARFVSEFTQLQALVFWEGPSEWWPVVSKYFSLGTLNEEVVAPPLSINSVFMHPTPSGSGGPTAPKILKWLTTQSPPGAIHTWFGTDMPPQSPTESRDFAARFKETLTRVSFFVYRCRTGKKSAHAFRSVLRTNALKHVRFNVMHYTMFPSIPKIVARLPPSLETICIVAGNYPEAATIWAYIDRVLTETALPSLRVFELLWVDRGLRMTHAELCQYLPRCSVEKNIRLEITNLSDLKGTDRLLEYFPYHDVR
ncbi:hypothetical protein R3P38DRAFT_2506934 [Favolaschia claudopus]|uniref:F-box domain-containing protein n=1 Tax=Favolaschia claudopus TaxID=2862362 RepID=A0AAW0D6N1_9AGAR